MERVNQVHWTEPLWKELHAISEDHDKLEQSLSPVLIRRPLAEKAKPNKKNISIDLSALDEFKIDSFHEIDFGDCRLEKEKIDVGVQSAQLHSTKMDQRIVSSSKKLEDLAKPKRSTTATGSSTTMTTRKKNQTNNQVIKRNMKTKPHSRSIGNVHASITAKLSNIPSETMSMKSYDDSETCSYVLSDYSEIPTITCDGEFNDVASSSSLWETSVNNLGQRIEEDEKNMSCEADFNLQNEQIAEAMPKDVFINKSMNATDFEYHSAPQVKLVANPDQVNTKRQEKYCTELKEYLFLPSPAVRSNCTISAIEKENKQCLVTLRRTDSLISKK